MIEQAIPEALHLCPGCDDLASGDLYCDGCTAVAKFYDALVSGAPTSCWSAPRAHPQADDPFAQRTDEENGGNMLRTAALALLFEGACVLLGFLAYRVWRVL